MPKKLGIKPDSTLTLISPPSNFLATLGPLPDGARVARSRRAATDLIILFVRSMAELKKGIAMLAARDDETHVWISWPKQSSPLAGNVSETQVRELGLAAGMVDFKVCAIDADWSGLKFSRKRK